ASARAALALSGADAVMIGRGIYGRPWAAAAIDAVLAGNSPLAGPDIEQRLGIVLDHMAESLAFYGDLHGLRIFRKHLGWYVEQAPWPEGTEEKRAAKARLCRLDRAADVEQALTAFWRGTEIREAA